MTTDALRKLYLDYFKAKDHRVFPSDSLVPADDPSLLFTGAGMNQFKPYFLGLKKDVKRAASCQKCLRTADLDRVGKTATHHSFFEMLGNFSFGDYFKEEAIVWGWEFVTRSLGLSKENLWVSVYQEDDEAFELWKKKIGLSESRMVRMGAEDNFWPSPATNRGGSLPVRQAGASGGNVAGPNGPCGPCSEIYVGKTPGKGVEIWNLVFTQYDRQSDGSLKDLPQRNIDTGMGLERTAAVIQDVESNFDIDTFAALRKEVHLLLKKEGLDRSHENAVMDHIRAVTFSIADGALPSNDGRGYVIRKIIRLATDHLNKAGALTPGTLHKLVPAVIRIMGAVYPELSDRQKTISSIVENEEKTYFEACRRAETARQGTMSAEEFAFMLYDTYGLPMDRIRAKFEKDGKNFDEKIFSKYLEEQRDRSRSSSIMSADIFSMNSKIALVAGLPPTQFMGYESLAEEAKLLFEVPEENVLIFDRSPFYAEAGGQVGDTGVIEGNGFKSIVIETQWMEKCIAHKVRVEGGRVEVGKNYKLSVEPERRADIMKNHTATHLLHSALRKVLGDHVKQSGSLVAQDYLRFDFTHFSAMTEAQIQEVERLINDEIRKNISLKKQVMSKDEAIQKGAVAFFGEKYGDQVRVVSVGDFSKELCGGTHLETTGQIGVFKIVSESSIQAGVRRIQAVTGRAAQAYLNQREFELKKIMMEFGAKDCEGLKASLGGASLKLRNLKGKLNGLAESALKAETRKLLAVAPKVGKAKLVCVEAPRADVDLIRSDYEYLKKEEPLFAAFFSAPFEDKVAYVVAASQEMVQRGFHSGEVIKEIAAEVKGSGGGRPDFAVGGSKDVGSASTIFATGRRILDARLRSVLKGA